MFFRDAEEIQKMPGEKYLKSRFAFLIIWLPLRNVIYYMYFFMN